MNNQKCNNFNLQIITKPIYIIDKKWLIKEKSRK